MNIPIDFPRCEFTAEDLLRLPDDGHSYELAQGRLVERHMGFHSSRIGGELYGQLRDFNRTQRVGWVMPADTTYQCFPDDVTKVRKPDASFIRGDRLPAGQEPEGHCRVAPDLAAEVVSPNDEFEAVVGKIEEWLAAGVRLVWLVSPRTRTIWVYRRDGSGVLLREQDELSGEDVLPGFRCAVREIFLPPPGVANPS